MWFGARWPGVGGCALVFVRPENDPRRRDTHRIARFRKSRRPANPSEPWFRVVCRTALVLGACCPAVFRVRTGTTVRVPQAGTTEKTGPRGLAARQLRDLSATRETTTSLPALPDAPGFLLFFIPICVFLFHCRRLFRDTTIRIDVFSLSREFPGHHNPNRRIFSSPALPVPGKQQSESTCFLFAL